MNRTKKKTDNKKKETIQAKSKRFKEKSLLKNNNKNIKSLKTAKKNKAVQFKIEKSVKPDNDKKSDSKKNSDDKEKEKENKNSNLDNKISTTNKNNKENKNIETDSKKNLKKSNSKNKNINKKKNQKDNLKKSKSIKTSEKKSTVKSKNSSTDKLKLLRNMVHTISKSKETLSTYVDTISTEKDKNEDLNTLQKNQEEIDETSNNDTKEIKAVFTPIPSLIKKSSKLISSYPTNIKDVEKAINLRRIQYNEYLKALNRPKPKPKPKPKVYDLEKVIEIQKLYRGFEIKNINQTINRLKINLCVTELLCLIFNYVFKHARRRITFYILKNYYHDPFTNIFEEVDFTDKMMMKLSDTYYNFNNFFGHKNY